MSDVSDQRRYYERMMDEIATEHRQQIDQFEAESAKLRDLCASLYARLKAASEATDEDWIDARLTKRMQELGIEVKE